MLGTTKSVLVKDAAQCLAYTRWSINVRFLTQVPAGEWEIGGGVAAGDKGYKERELGRGRSTWLGLP